MLLFKIITKLQPPSGGCVLKPYITLIIQLNRVPAAFGRLCVETRKRFNAAVKASPAAFGRLCVETRLIISVFLMRSASRLRAAVC